MLPTIIVLALMSMFIIGFIVEWKNKEIIEKQKRQRLAKESLDASRAFYGKYN